LDEWVEETKETIERLSEHINVNGAKRLLAVYVVTDVEEEKRSIRQDIETILGPGKQLLLESENSFMRVPPEELDGEIVLGTIIQGGKRVGRFAVRRSDLTRHVGVYAQTGHGKSVLLYNLAEQLIDQSIGFWFFDVKQDGRALLSNHEQLIVLPWQLFRWNPLRPPPKMNVKLWWQLFSEVCGHAWGVYHAGINYLLEFLDQLYEDYQKTGVFPTLGDLHRLMVASQETSRKRMEYYDVMYNRTRTLTSILGKMLNSENGLKLEDLVNHFVVFELDQLRAEEQNWLIEVMLTWLYAYRMTEQHRGEELRQVIICDEAHRIWDANKEWRDTTREMGMPTINLFPTQFRDFGVSLILTSQESSKMTQSVHANTLVKIVGNLGNGTDINSIAEAMGLDDEEREIIHKLKRGEWLVKLSDKYTEPFMIQTADYPVDKHVSDQAVADRLRKLLPELQIDERAEAIGVAKIIETGPRLIKSQLSPDAWGLLVNVCQHPFLGLKSRCYALKISGRRIETAFKDLAERHLVVAKEFAPLEKFRAAKFMLLTEDSLNLLSDFGYDTSLWKKIGNVGWEHSLYQVLIAYSLRKKGYEATIEKKLPSGRRLDVYCYDGHRKTGIEIELTTKNIEEKIEGIDELDDLVILVKDEESLRDGLMFLKARPAIKNVTIQKVSEFLREHSTKNSHSSADHESSLRVTKPSRNGSGTKVS
jgi:hypothetical protein